MGVVNLECYIHFETLSDRLVTNADLSAIIIRLSLLQIFNECLHEIFLNDFYVSDRTERVHARARDL